MPKLVNFKSIEYVNMSESQIKRSLEDRGHRIIDVARHMAKDFPITEGSAETMLHEMIAGRRWFPVYAGWLDERYSIVLKRPESAKPVRERMRQAA
jgi:hypothetical protein